MAIFYHVQDVSDVLFQKRKHKAWIKSILESKDKEAGNINYIFCSDAYLLEINQEHLNHNTLTDIITFDLSETDQEISADIYISVDRVQDNAQAFNIDLQIELRRVMIHGVLHLLGFGDKTSAQKQAMRNEEDLALARFDPK